MSSSIAAQSEAEYLQSGYQRTLAGMLALANQAESWAGFAGTVLRAAPHALYRSACSLVAGTAPTWEEQLLALPMPRVFVVGERNLPYPGAAGLPAGGVPVMAVPGAGHGMMDENPQGLARVLAEALN